MSREPVFRGELEIDDEPGSTSLEAWRRTAEASLKGRPVETLRTTIHEGIEIEPLYTAADGPVPDELPGSPPFTRGARDRGGWQACPCVRHPDPGEAARQLADEAGRGADGAYIVLDGAVRRGLAADDPRAAGVGGDGVLAFSVDEMELLLRAMDLPRQALHLEAGGAAPAVAAVLAAAAERAGVGAEALHGSLGLDPLGSLVADGELPGGLEHAFDEMAHVVRWAGGRLPAMRTVTVSAVPVQAEGATAVQALAFALASGVACLRALERGGVPPEEALSRTMFRWATDRDLFTQLAALRALRRLWWRVADACGVSGEAAAARVHAVTSRRTLTRRDPWVNLLRGTVQGFAAVAGGADVVTVLPFDHEIGPSDALARRMALNTHTILREESHLDRLVDPAGGSWYVERLTDQLAAAAWAQLQEIEADGGAVAWLEKGGLDEMLAGVRSARRQAVASRRDPVTGVSTWPHLDEKPVLRPAGDAAAVRAGIADAARRRRRADVEDERLGAVGEADAGARMDAAEEAAAAGVTVAGLAAALAGGGEPARRPLPAAERDAEMFERLRDASDAHLERRGHRPLAFLAAMGPLASYTARATWVTNLLAAGGIETVDRGGFDTVVDAVDAFDGTDARVAVVCASDARYPEVVPELAGRLKEHGARWVLLAGRPGEHEEGWRQAGVDAFVYAGRDVHEVLSAVLVDLEVLS